MILQLSKKETLSLKGIALLLLLFHHLFYMQNGLYDDVKVFKGQGLVWMISMACKLCVPLFVFLSGYGLAASVEKLDKINWKKFFIRRFTKLYSNYWLIWLLFVPAGILLFGRSLETAYQDHITENFILDFLGLINCTGRYGYNVTWWFYSCIILLYLLFPLVLMANKNRILCHIIFWGSLFLAFLPLGSLNPIRYYFFPFVLGCYFRYDLAQQIFPSFMSKQIKRSFGGGLKKWELCLTLLLIVLYVPYRFKLPEPLLWDSLIVILIVITFKNVSINSMTEKTLSFLGVHSFNIFLFHTFIFLYYFEEFTYWSSNPIICLITLTAASIGISLFIEYLKKIMGFNKLTESFLLKA